MVQPLSYETLKHFAANDVTLQGNLEDLKYMFRNEIGSARNMYRIRTMYDLIDCLERHDALSELNIEPLREIADEYGGCLADVITGYNVPKNVLSAEPYNVYREMRLADEYASLLNISGQKNNLEAAGNANSVTHSVNNNKPHPAFSQTLPKEKRSAIYKLIAGDIGTDWRRLGRELELRQGTLDDIEMQYRDLNTRVYKLFQAFEEDESVDAKEHLSIICRALDECRRKDLRRKIEKIMSN